MFAAGDMVVCICSKWQAMEGSSAELPPNAPMKGLVYSVASMFRATSEDYRWLVELEGIVHGYDADAFRKVKKSNLDCFTALLRPTPVKRKFRAKKKADVCKAN